jgi:aminocarboxymuconate-semialdehyde decarboxylase
MSARKLADGPIDIHAHVVVPEIFAVTKAHSVFMRPPQGVTLSDEARAGIEARATFVIASMGDMEARVGHMDAMGVGIQVLSASLVHQCTYWAAPDEALAMDKHSNDWVAERVARNPSRFMALGTVPLQAPDLAAAELRRCMRELGFTGVNISTRVGDMELGDPRLRPFWEAAAEEGALVYIHPAGNPDPRFSKHFLWNSIGQSFEEAMAIASLMYEGVLESFPSLAICISHGGGYMPYYMGRIERNWIEKPTTRVNMKRSPTEYLKTLWYDTCVYDTRALRVLADTVGVDRIVLGTDYPVGDRNPHEFVGDCGFSEAEVAGIMRGNAERMLFGG